MNTNFITINSKCYPLDDDGGTCFTSYEVAKAAELHGFKSHVIIPSSFGTEKKISSSNISIEKVNYFTFYKRVKNLSTNCENIIYYNCAFNMHIIITLVTLTCLRICNYKIKAKYLFSGHGSFNNSLLSSFYKKLWIKFIIRSFILISKARYLANSKGELDELCSSLVNLKNIKYKVADNKFPSFIFENELDILNRSKEEFLDTKFGKYILYLGRIVPKKRLLETIDFLSTNGWFDNGGLFVIAHANDDLKYLEKVNLKIKQLSLQEKVLLVGKVSGFKKWKLILNSSAFILLSTSEGLPMTLLEADTLDLPIICTKECNYLPTSKNSIIVSNMDNNFSVQIKSIIATNPLAYLRVSELDYKKLHTNSGFYSSFKEIFDEKY